jgi:hypothetical protein
VSELTHLQVRRLRQLNQLDQKRYDATTTSHWNSSRRANEVLQELGFVERYGQTFYQPSGKTCYVGDARITADGREWLVQNHEHD